MEPSKITVPDEERLARSLMRQLISPPHNDWERAHPGAREFWLGIAKKALRDLAEPDGKEKKSS